MAGDEDFVEYFLFVWPDGNAGDAEETAKYLDRLNADVLKLVDRLADQYIWHMDQFNLIPRFCPSAELRQSFSDTSDEVLPPHLYGITHFGDNSVDEWFIVYLMKEITKEYPEIIVRIIDSDGEFLLIEAVEFLPDWVNSSNCDQRAYICDGDVHLIPLSSDNHKKSITVSQALEQISKFPTATIATQEVNTAIESRLHGYPEKIKENLHRCHAYVPAGVAYLLKHQPSLIAPAVVAFFEAFRYGDPLDVRACHVMKNFPPKDRVMQTVTMTKCLYATLDHQDLNPEIRTNWNLVGSSDSQHKIQLTGIKIACGFEILASQAKSTVKDTPVDFTNDKHWHQYKSSLADKEYFKNLYEGSNEYKLLEDLAKQYYLSNVDEYLSSPSISQRIKSILDGFTEDVLVQMKNDITDLEPADDETWLDVSPTDLDRIRLQRFGVNDSELTSNMASSIPDKIRSVLNWASDFSKNHLSDDYFDSNYENKPANEKFFDMLDYGPGVMFSPNNDDVNIKPAHYEAELRNILDFKIPEENLDESNSFDMDSDGSDCDETMSASLPGPSFSTCIDQMDKEFASTSIGSSSIKKSANDKDKPIITVMIVPTIQREESEELSLSDLEDSHIKLQPILKSYRKQRRLPDPVGNHLGPAGLNLGQEPS